jgi:hypothetical protein
VVALVIKEWSDIKTRVMKGYHYSLLVFSPHAFIREMEELRLPSIIMSVDNQESFCRAHELVDRNRITAKAGKILKETQYEELREFRFLINKN